MQQKNKVIVDESRRFHFKAIYNRIYKGKSTLITGEIGSGKTVFLKTICPDKLKISSVESLGSLNHILLSILKQQQYKYTLKINKSFEYLEAICGLKKIIITIDDVNDLRSGIFR